MDLHEMLPSRLHQEDGTLVNLEWHIGQYYRDSFNTDRAGFPIKRNNLLG